jgi:hypothetical protein
VSWLRTDPCFSLADGQILALRVRVSVRVASARAWVKTRQGIGASKVMEGGQSCVCVCVCVCTRQSVWQQTLNRKGNNF